MPAAERMSAALLLLHRALALALVGILSRGSAQAAAAAHDPTAEARVIDGARPNGSPEEPIPIAAVESRAWRSVMPLPQERGAFTFAGLGAWVAEEEAPHASGGNPVAVLASEPVPPEADFYRGLQAGVRMRERDDLYVEGGEISLHDAVDHAAPRRAAQEWAAAVGVQVRF